MKTSHAAFILALSAALPAAADSPEPIGTLQATFDGETITQTTVRFGQGDDRGATAEFSSGFGSTDLSIYGADVGRQLSVELMFPGDAPGPASAPMLTAVNWFPRGMADHWSSEEAPTPPVITFTRLEAAGDEGHATGSFTATLCAVPAPAAPDCRPISGSFDTRLLRRAD